MNGDVEQEKWTEEGFYKANRSLMVTIDGKEYDLDWGAGSDASSDEQCRTKGGNC